MKTRATDEILEHAVIEVPNDLVVRIHDGMGYRMLMRGNVVIASDSIADIARCAKLFMELRRAKPQGGKVAVLGCGFALLPNALVGLYNVDVYEVEPALERYLEHGGFVAGRWQDTLVDMYDAIILDTGEEGCEDTLRAHLDEGGVLLGV